MRIFSIKGFFRHLFVLALLLVGSALGSGCASLTKGSRQVVPITTDPSGAEVVHRGKVLGETPLEHAFPRRTAHRLVIRKEGYVTEEVFLYTVPNEAETQFVRFSWEQRRGSYQDLAPAEVDLTLRPFPE